MTHAELVELAQYLEELLGENREGGGWDVKDLTSMVSAARVPEAEVREAVEYLERTGVAWMDGDGRVWLMWKRGLVA